MDMEGSKVTPKLPLLLDADILEVLVPEDHDAAFGDEKGKFVLLAVVEPRKLQTSNLGANDWSQLGGLDGRVVFGEKAELLLVGYEPAVIELEWLERRERCLLVVDRQVLGVFVLSSMSACAVASIHRCSGLLGHGSCRRRPRST